MDQSAIVMLRRVYVQKSGGFIGFCALSLDGQPQVSRVDSSLLDLLRALRGPAIGRMMLSIGRMVGDRMKSDLAEADLLRFELDDSESARGKLAVELIMNIS
jgi:hypothetical protein